MCNTNFYILNFFLDGIGEGTIFWTEWMLAVITPIYLAPDSLIYAVMVSVNLIEPHTLFQNPAIFGSTENSISFSDTGINSDIIDALKEQEITEPTVIQVCFPALTCVESN